MEQTGKKWVIGIGLYLIAKAAFNLILGVSASNILMLIVAVSVCAVLIARVPYIQYIVAVWLLLMVLAHTFVNIRHFSTQWIYLLEGILDLGAAAVLVFEKNVRAYFKK